MAGEVTTATSQAIYRESLNAYSDPKHPCHVFRSLQHGVPEGAWQLPEPFNGASAGSGLVFLGLNPSYSPSEDVPRIGTPFEAWDHFYRRRFDADVTDWALLYRRYQSVGEVALGHEFRLGRDALVLEIVRFRSEKGEGLTDEVLSHELPITRQILAEIAPTVIIAVGRNVVWQLRRIYAELLDAVPDAYRIRDIEGATFTVHDETERALHIIASPHLTGAFGLSNERIAAIGRAAGRCLS